MSEQRPCIKPCRSIGTQIDLVATLVGNNLMAILCELLGGMFLAKVISDQENALLLNLQDQLLHGSTWYVPGQGN